MLPSRVFVTGTDTNVGKTVIASIITAGFSARYWKPVQSGLSEPPDAATDSQWVQNVLALEPHDIVPEAYRFALAASPHLAASNEGARISMAKIVAQYESLSKDFSLVVEGAGGVLVPLNERELIIDLISCLNLPVIVVASTRLGTINHTLLTIEALRSRKVEVTGIVMNGLPNSSSKEAIENFSSLPVIAEVPLLNSFDKDSLLAAYENCFIHRRVSVTESNVP